MGILQLLIGKEKKVKINPYVIPVKNAVQESIEEISNLSTTSVAFFEDMEKSLKGLLNYLRNYKMNHVTNLGQVNQSIVVRKINYWLKNNRIVFDLLEEYRNHPPQQKKISKLKKNVLSDLRSFVSDLNSSYHQQDD